MKPVFADRTLERLYTEGAGRGRYPPEVVDAFLRRVRHIEAARDERDLRIPPSVHYERLRGRHKGKDSMRLNQQWRLIVSVASDAEGKVVVIHEISRHYEG